MVPVYTKDEINNKTIDQLIDILDNSNNKIQIVLLLSIDNITQLLYHTHSKFYTTDLCVNIFIKTLQDNSIYDILNSFIIKSPTEFFPLIKEHADICRIINGLKIYYQKIYNKNVIYELFSRNIIIFSKDTKDNIKEIYMSLKNSDIFLERLKKCILILELIFHTHNEYYDRQKEFRMDYNEICGQLEAFEVQERFDAFLRQYSSRFVT